MATNNDELIFLYEMWRDPQALHPGVLFFLGETLEGPFREHPRIKRSTLGDMTKFNRFLTEIW